jgi:OOP family OmpA-OmpF porin
MLIALLAGCAHPVSNELLKDFKPQVPKGQLIQKVDHLAIIFDASRSMADPYRGWKKLNYSRYILSIMNQTIRDLNMTVCLRTFGQAMRPMEDKTKLIYGPIKYSDIGLQKAIDTVAWASGQSPLAKAIDATTEDIQNVTGKIAVLIISDTDSLDDKPIKAAERMKKRFGDRLCIYTILIGNDSAGEALLSQIATIGSCGFAVNANNIASSLDMANYTEKVFYDQPGERQDSDGDGVPDDTDACPGTPQGAFVNEKGCWVLGDILFATGKAELKPEMYKDLDNVVSVLDKNRNLWLQIQGHTDNVGTMEYNMSLSDSRAKAVRTYFLKKGVDPKRIAVKGFGFSKPIASNDSEEGRSKNRRVELKPIN